MKYAKDALRVGFDRAIRPPSWGTTRPVTVDSGQKQATGTWIAGGEVLHSYLERLAVEPGEGQMGNVGLPD